MNKSAYLLFAALAAGLGLWGFWLGRSSVQPAERAVAVASAPAAPVPAPAEAAPAPEAPAAVEPAAEAVSVKPAKTPRMARVAAAKKVEPVGKPVKEAAAPMAPQEVSPGSPAVPSAPAPLEPAPPKPVETAKVFKPEKEYESATPPKPREPHTATIPAGTLISVRLREALSSERNSSGDTFMATLDQPLIVDGFVIAEKGAPARGHIAELAQAGRVKGRAALALELKSLTTSDGQRIDLETDTFRREAESGVKKDAVKTGVMAGIGAAIGAIAGGGKGAAIGAGIGGATGAGTVLATRGQDASLPAETRLTFRLKNPVTITEKLN